MDEKPKYKKIALLASIVPVIAGLCNIIECPFNIINDLNQYNEKISRCHQL